MRQARAVEARMDLDLRIGAILTRTQTLGLQPRFGELDSKVLSYGSFTCLSFVGLSQLIGVCHDRSLPVPHARLRRRPIRARAEFHSRDVLVHFCRARARRRAGRVSMEARQAVRLPRRVRALRAVRQRTLGEGPGGVDQADAEVVRLFSAQSEVACRCHRDPDALCHVSNATM